MPGNKSQRVKQNKQFKQKWSTYGEVTQLFKKSKDMVQMQINPLCLLTLWEAREGMRTGEFPNSFIEVAVL